MQDKPYEKIWNFLANPLSIEPAIEFKCPFHKRQQIGIIERMYGNAFQFELKLHGDAEKQSHAIDTWMRCDTCGFTVVHGVAIPKAKYEEFINLVLSLPQYDDDGKPMSASKVPKYKNAIIFHIDKTKERKMKKSKPMWQETNNVEGLRPLFKVQCKFCGRKESMFLRHSRMHIVKREQILKQFKLSKRLSIRFIKLLGQIVDVYAFRISYKCPICDWLATFIRPVRPEYFNKILELRKGEPLYYPPLKEWKSEDELIQEKLESLGYV